MRRILSDLSNNAGHRHSAFSNVGPCLLSTSNIRGSEPGRDDRAESPLARMEHIKPDRSEDDTPYDLVLELGSISAFLPRVDRWGAGRLTP